MDNRRKQYRGVDSSGTYIVLTLMGLCMGLVSLALGAAFFGLPMLAAYFGDPVLMLLNLLPPLPLTFLLYLAVGRAWVAVLAASAVILSIASAGFIKLALTLEPLTASDLSFTAPEAGGALYFDWRLLAAVLFIALGTFFTFHLTGRGLAGQTRLRLAGIAAIVVISALLYCFVYTSDAVYGLVSADYPIDAASATQRYIARGGIYPFINSIPAAFRR